MEFIVRGLLAHSECHWLTNAFLYAQRDLDKALRIAERGEMSLCQVDCHLEFAQFELTQGNSTLAREHWATAKEMIERIGYHRRDRNLEEIARELG